MDEALVENSQHDVYRNERGEDQQGHIGQGVPEGGCRSLKICLQACRHVHFLLNLCDLGDCASQGGVGGEIERDCDCRELSLVGDGERLGSGLEVREGAEWHSVAGG